MWSPMAEKKRPSDVTIPWPHCDQGLPSYSGCGYTTASTVTGPSTSLIGDATKDEANGTPDVAPHDGDGAAAELVVVVVAGAEVVVVPGGASTVVAVSAAVVTVVAAGSAVGSPLHAAAININTTARRIRNELTPSCTRQRLPTVECYQPRWSFRNSVGLMSALRLKNLVKFVGSEKPSSEEIEAAVLFV